jgi:hypothetical protein
VHRHGDRTQGLTRKTRRSSGGSCSSMLSESSDSSHSSYEARSFAQSSTDSMLTTKSSISVSVIGSGGSTS